MNLGKKKELAAKALKVGKNRISFNVEGLSEIKEAITKQDIKTLVQEGIITIKPVKGRRKIRKRKTRKGAGKIKKKVKHRKQGYVKITRKLRTYLKQLRDRGIMERELYWELRKKIRMRIFKSKARLKEYLESIEKIDLGRKVEKKRSNVKKGKAGKVQASKSEQANSKDLKDTKKNEKEDKK